jgi:hypothetical protein
MVHFPVWTKDLSHFPGAQNGSGAHPASYLWVPWAVTSTNFWVYVLLVMKAPIFIYHIQYFSFTLREKNVLNKMSLRFTLDIPCEMSQL